jgi:hypothetical protein
MALHVRMPLKPQLGYGAKPVQQLQERPGDRTATISGERVAGLQPRRS